ELHSKVTPVTVAFEASRATAVSCRVWPTSTDVGVGVTTMLAIPTATNAVPVTPSLAAVIVTVPALSPVTRPVLDPSATASLLELPPTARSVSTVVPDRTVAVSWTDAPTARLLDAGATLTLVTGMRLTVIVAEPVFPSIAARMTARPAPTAWTTPAADNAPHRGATE